MNSTRYRRGRAPGTKPTASSGEPWYFTRFCLTIASAGQSGLETGLLPGYPNLDSPVRPGKPGLSDRAYPMRRSSAISGSNSTCRPWRWGRTGRSCDSRPFLCVFGFVDLKGQARHGCEIDGRLPPVQQSDILLHLVRPTHADDASMHPRIGQHEL